MLQPLSNPADSRPVVAQSSRFRLPSFVAASTVWWLFATPAEAVRFQFSFGTGVSNDLQDATLAAGDQWSSRLEDNVTVNIRVEYADLSEAGSVLGGVQPGKVKIKYEDYVDALFEDAISSNDYWGLSSLPLSAKGREVMQDFQTGNVEASGKSLETKTFSFLMDGRFARGKGSSSSADFIDSNGNDNNKSLQLTRAQAKALNLLENKGNKLDALITINSNVPWDFDSRDGVEGNRYDASSVLQHEIGHALGFVSGVDAFDFLSAASEPIEDIEKNQFSYLTPLDFYRYSNKSAELGVVDATLGGDSKFFSLDNGESAVTDSQGRRAYFSTGSLGVGGDGYQGSHWQAQGNPLGVMNPNLQAGQSIAISELDLALLDVVGWNLEDPNIERARAIGFDWTGLNEALARDRQLTVEGLTREWGDRIPQFEAALSDRAVEIDIEFRRKIQEKFEKMLEKIEKEGDKKRSEEIAKFYEEVEKETEKRDEKLGKLPKEILKVDEEVGKWIDLPVDKLADKLREADGQTVNRFANIVRILPEDERDEVEERLEDAVGQFADKPNKLVEELLDTSGPANPVGWNRYLNWWWWWQEAGDTDDDIDIDEPTYYAAIAPENIAQDIDQVSAALTSGSDSSSTETNSMEFAPIDSAALKLTTYSGNTRDSQEVPESSSVLALFGISAIGVGLLRRQRAE